MVREVKEFREGSYFMRTALPKFPLIVVREFKEFREFKEGPCSTVGPIPKLPNFPKFPNKKPLPQRETTLLSEWCSSGDDMKKPPMGST